MEAAKTRSNKNKRYNSATGEYLYTAGTPEQELALYQDYEENLATKETKRYSECG